MSYPKILITALFAMLFVVESLSEFNQALAVSTHKFVTQTTPSGLLIKNDGIPGRYIVVFQSQSEDQIEFQNSAISNAVATQYGATIQTRWTHALNGMAVTMTAEATAEMAQDPRVAWIEQDSPLYIDHNIVDQTTKEETQNFAPWGLDRIDQRDLPLDGVYNYSNDGFGVTVYTLDTGIRLTHQEFGGRATWGTNIVGDGEDTDCTSDGYGTAVASIVGGATYGVAKKVNLVAVKVMDCDKKGSIIDAITGVDWVITNKKLPAIINSSISASYSASWNQAVTRAATAGIIFTASAGYKNIDACQRSPSSAPEAISAGGTKNTDARDPQSNWGTCVDLFTPDLGITTASNGSDNDIIRGSGTYASAAFAAGASALYLQDHPDATPAAVAAALVANATTGKITDPGTGSPNLLLFNNFDAPLDLPDLIIETVSAGASAQPGGKLTVSILTKNQGTISAAASRSMIYLSNDKNITRDDFSTNQYCDIPVLNSGKTSYCSGPIAIPAGVTPGIYYVGAFADDQKVVSESNEDNNVLAANTITTIGDYFTLQVTESGSGIVTSNPTGISCGNDCSENYASGTPITLTAKVVGESIFSGWGGDCSGTALTCTITMTKNMDVTASFNNIYTLQVTKSGNGTITSNPAGINCGNDCSENYASSTPVTLTATADNGSNFSGWGGDCSSAGIALTCTITMNTNKNVSAIFSNPPHYLYVHIIKPEDAIASVTSDPAGINCPTDECSHAFSDPITLTAQAIKNATFVSWIGKGINCKTTTCKFTLNSDLHVYAKFKKPETYPLTVNISGNGSVKSDPEGINCKPDNSGCEYGFEKNKPVTLTAKEDSGYVFTGWKGDCIGGTSTCEIKTMDRNKTVTAIFDKVIPVVLTVSGLSNRGHVTVTPPGVDCLPCEEKYNPPTLTTPSTEVVLTATSEKRFLWKSWTGCNVGSGYSADKCIVTMDKSRNVEVNFIKQPYKVLTIKNQNPKNGTVDSVSPDTDIHCGKSCTKKYPKNRKVVLEANPNNGCSFRGWKPDSARPPASCTGVGICSLTMTQAWSITVNFTCP